MPKVGDQHVCKFSPRVVRFLIHFGEEMAGGVFSSRHDVYNLSLNSIGKLNISCKNHNGVSCIPFGVSPLGELCKGLGTIY